MRNTADKSRMRESLQNTWAIFFRTVEVMKIRKDRESGSDSREHTDLMIKCNVASCSRKGTLGEVAKN